MKNTKIIAMLVATGLLAGGAYALYQLGIRQGVQAAANRIPVANADKKILYWQDPMTPTQKFDKPGKSPFMDMPLVPVYADAVDEGSVVVSPRIQQNLGMRTAEVVRGSLGGTLSAVGNVAYNEREMVFVQARNNGYLEKLFVRAPLDTVQKGQALAELYMPEWVAAQEEFLTAKHLQSGGIDGLLDGAKQRMRLVGMTDEQIRLVESSGKVHPRLTVVAPVAGVISELAVREGMAVATGAPMFRINGLETIWVNAEIPENLAAQVHVGNAVEASTASLPGTLFKGKIDAVLPQIDAGTRTLKARIELRNVNRQLLPGMFVKLSFNTFARQDMLLIPSEAVIQTGTRTLVMLDKGNGQFTPAEIETGMESKGRTEVTKGLDIGKKVVVSGQFLIDSEASLKGISARLGNDTQDVSGKPAAQPVKSMPVLHHASGVVEKIAQDEITISHDAIASLHWDAMTMSFKLPPAGLPQSIRVGSSVHFEIQQTRDGAFQITEIVPAENAAGGKR